MKWLVLIGVLAVAAFVWLYRGRTAPEPEQKLPAEAKKYRAVSLRICGQACQAAKANRSRRFLLHEAPSLPLPGCDAATCGCGYVHHPDRREDELSDRRMIHGIGADLMVSADRAEKRHKVGRRRTDAA